MSSPSAVPVRFGADAPAPAPMTWGQLAIWDVLRWLPADDDSLNQLDWLPVPDGTRLDQVTAALRIVVERHQSLRTTYAEEDGRPVQRVLAAGELALELSAATAADLGEAARALGDRLRRGAFDNAHDLPIRAAVLLRDGSPAAIVLVISHMAVDGWSFQVVTRDLRTLLGAPVPTVDALPPRARQPVERAAFELSAGGERLEAATLEHWSSRLRSMSPTMLEKPAGPEAVSGDWARIDSPATALAAEALATRAGTNPGTVLMAMLALLLAFRVDEPEAAMRLIVTTRFTAEDRDFVGAFNQNALLHLRLREESAQQYLRRAAASAFAAYRRCEADPRKVEQLVADIARERGFTPDGYCFFNDVRFTGADRSARAQGDRTGPAPEAVTAALGRTRLERLHKDERQKGAKLFVYLQELQRTCRITLCLDPAFLGSYRGVDLLADLERLLVRSAIDPDASVAEVRRSISPALSATTGHDKEEDIT
ncbi:condensation domain-containing protein [Streptomyces polygonati]|uniref:Condensation domain-containing protein n=1 Tax=Streptomyces polygonati TaxID=1617087 RepID=A0ABV8HWU8_9ACTN